MSDFEQRLKDDLGPLLELRDPRERISVYHDMPYALFRYDPEEEIPLRKAVTLLETRLQQKGKRVKRISLAECLDEAMRSQRALTEWFDVEREQGVDTVVDTIHSVLADYAPLVDLVAHRMPEAPDPLRDVVFILRTGALFPMYRTFSLLEQLKGLGEVMGRINERADYGENPSGRYLTDELAREPFGWDFDVVRLLVVCLLRAGRIEATSKSQTIDNAVSVEARDTFCNNNLFRQASFRPKRSVDFEALVKAAEGFRDTFGSEVKELAVGSIVQEIRRELTRHEDTVAGALALLTTERLPGASMLEMALGQMKAIQRGSEDGAIDAWSSAHRAIKDAIRRASEVEQALTEPRLRDLGRAKQALMGLWPALEDEPDLDDALRARAAALADLLKRETFFRELPSIDQHTLAIETEHARRYQSAIAERATAYERAFKRLVQTPGWTGLDEDVQRRIAVPLQRGMKRDQEGLPIPQILADSDACDARLKTAVGEVLRVMEGERLVSVNLGSYFGGGVETEEQLDAALAGVREECARLIGAGKKVIVS